MNTTTFTQAAAQIVGFAEKILTEDLTPEGFRDACKGMPLQQAATLQRDMADIVERFSAVKAELQKLYDFVRFTFVPGVMEDEGIESAKVEGVGRVYLNSDVNVSIRTGKSEDAQVWLVDSGNGDLIKETVNSSSLKALVKSMMKKGEEVPAEIFNVSPYTRAQIAKS